MNTDFLLGSKTLAALAEAIATSELVPEAALAAAQAGAVGDLQTFAKLLVTERLLTRFQIETLSQGRGASLRVGNYDILDRLGAGGMGTVYKARHRRMKRLVALKVLAAKHSDNPVFVKRFQREVETIASLGHPNVVMAYDADVAEVGHFLVMEFVDGRDLADWIVQHGAFSLAGAVNCIAQAARGLAYAHSQGIIHRDIKPQNLMLDNHGVVKVTDLGLARLSHDVEVDMENQVTMAGGVIGTVDYMSPEQAIDSTTLDHRSDIYSLGCSLHYLLAGKPPYSGATIMSILLKHRDSPIPSLSKVWPETPPQLDDLFRRMLAKQPEQRIQHMSEVVDELDSIARVIGSTISEGASGATAELPTGPPRKSEAMIATSELPNLSLQVTLSQSPITVLVVEPSRVQASIIKHYLQEHFMEVVGSVSSAQDAISVVHALRPRAVISAMHLLDTNGVQLAEQIRSEINIDAPGFVLITSEEDDNSSGELNKLTRVQLLRKPFTASQLVDTLNEVAGEPATLPSSVANFDLAVPTRHKADRSQMRVLIVDDSSAARMHVRTVLRQLGFSQFLEDPDGAHAIATATREICHLIVTDYNMPLMDGRALVSYLKQNPATSAIPIVMVTTETDPRVLDPVRKLGVIAVVEKAFPAAVVGPLMDSLF